MIRLSHMFKTPKHYPSTAVYTVITSVNGKQYKFKKKHSCAKIVLVHFDNTDGIFV